MKENKYKNQVFKYVIMGAVSIGIAYFCYAAPSKVADKILTFIPKKTNKGEK